MLELNLIVAMITHPAGYVVDLFGGLLSVRGADEGNEQFTVEWQNKEIGVPTFRLFDSAKEAVEYFLSVREKYKIGLDMEKSSK